LRDWSAVPYHFPAPIECQDSIAAAVEKEQFLFLIDGEPARIGDTRVVAEGAQPSGLKIRWRLESQPKRRSHG